ncbi:hypothetical protein GQ457_13G005570 [Hibiscus cannabinus]
MSWNRRRRLNGFKETCAEHRAEEDKGEPEYEEEEETVADWRLCGPSVPVPLRQRLYNCYYKLIYDMGEPLPEYVRRRNCYGLETVWTFSSSAPAAKAIQLLLQAHLEYMLLKKSKDGKRFGFVRFSSRADAQRAISRLNGLVLYGFRILVSLARYNVRNSFWKKVSPKVHDEAKDDGLKQVHIVSSSPVCVEAIIDKVVLDRLRSCIIVTTKQICNVDKLFNLLNEKGLDEFRLRNQFHGMSWNRRRRLNGFKETCVEHRAEEDKGEPEYEEEEETVADWRLCGPSVPVPLRQRLYNCYYKLIYDMGEPLPEYVRRRNCYGLETVWTFSSSAPAAKAIQLLLQAHLGESGIVTVFVSNLPPRFHWKGLWETFAHHGEVVDAFIPLKKSKDGKRFGFVRFSSRADAQRAISRLNGLVLYGFRILVSLARYNVRNSFWKKVSPKVHDEAKDDGLKQVHIVSSSPVCVEAIIDKVVLDRLLSCIIVTTKQICNVDKLFNLLNEKGLDEFRLRNQFHGMSWNRRRRLNGFKETCVEHRAEEDKGEPEYEEEEETVADWRLCGPSVPVPLRQRLYNCYYKLIYDMGEPLPEYVRRRNCYGLETVWTFSSSAPAAKAIQLLLQAHLGESGIVTVFVSNLPPRFHWKGLWETFAHHGEVVDAFIPLKKSKDGKRFGFVRFSSRADAQRAISRLNGLVLYGFRILVSLARYNVRNSFWKKVSPKVHDEAKDDGLKQVHIVSSSPVCVEAIIDKVVLDRLLSCIIVTTKQICNVDKLFNLLNEKGLDEFRLRRRLNGFKETCVEHRAEEDKGEPEYEEEEETVADWRLCGPSVPVPLRQRLYNCYYKLIYVWFLHLLLQQWQQQ